LSARFYKQNHIPDKKHCALVLRVGLAMSAEVHFRILGVRRDNDRLIVGALANGAPGKIVIKEAGRFRVLSVSS